jgi:hypothetical protein
MTMADHERRRAPRHKTVRMIVQFGWWDGPNFHRKYAQIWNLSRLGVLLICKFPPPAAGSEVWLTLACHAPEPWHPAKVVATTPLGYDRWETRLVFPDPFPDYQFGCGKISWRTQPVGRS